jgi:hypothetical protein
MSPMFSDITPCSPLKFNQRFGGTCHLHLQGGRVSQDRVQHEASSKQRSTETPAEFQLITQCYILDDRNLPFFELNQTFYTKLTFQNLADVSCDFAHHPIFTDFKDLGTCLYVPLRIPTNMIP